MVDAREYHERTNHSPRSVREDDFQLDYTNRPRPAKVYSDLPRVDLAAVHPPAAPALSVIAEATADPLAATEQSPPGPPDRETLATLCYEASGVVKTVSTDDGEMLFRAASCTGKLYHIDLYLVCGDLPDLDAGVYHFDPHRFALDVLREGDYRGVLADATGRHSGVAAAPVTVVATSTWWRNAWKYRARTYRHAFWDAGTVLGNFLAAAHGLDHRAELVAGFADDAVAELLGLDPTDEAPLALVPVGADTGFEAAPAVEPIDPATEPLSATQEAYPLIHDAWRQSAITDGDAAAEWRETCLAAGPIGRTVPGDGDRIALEPVDHETASARPLHRTIVRRGSQREFSREPLSRRKLGTVLDRATRGVPGDWNGGAADGLQYTDVYCLVTDVAEVPDGTYQYHPEDAMLERLGEASREVKTHLALDQPWAGDAHVNVYLMADIDRVVDRLGNRGYRLAQLEAGTTLGRLYLAAYAHRELGGTGLTFYDEEVADHLAPRAADQLPTCLFAFGRRD